MTHLKSNITGSHCTYPIEYAPAPLIMAYVWVAWQQPHEGASNPLWNVVKNPDAFFRRSGGSRS